MVDDSDSEVKIELPKELILAVKSANGRRNSIRPLIEHFGREKSLQMGPEMIASIVSKIRGQQYGYILPRAKELLVKESRKTVTDSGLVVSDTTTVTKQSKVLAPQRAIPPLPDDICVTAENGKGRTIKLRELIPKATDAYFRKRIGNKTDVDALLELYHVCNCVEPNYEPIDGADTGKAHGIKFCKACGKPDWREPVILHGDPGCGKNRLVDEVAEILQIPVVRVQFDGTTVPADICGEVMQNLEGKWSWVDRFLTIAVRYGCIFVGDELNMANHEVTSLLHHLLEKNGKLVVAANSEVIRPHPNFWFIGTMNKDLKGTKPLNEALRDRCVTIEIGDSKKIAYKLTNDKKLVDAMYTLKKNPEKLSHPIGLRSMIRFVKVQKQLGTKFAIEEFCAKFTADEAIDIKKALTVLIPRTEQTTMVEDEDKEDKDWTDDDTNPGDDGEKDDDEDEDDE